MPVANVAKALTALRLVLVPVFVLFLFAGDGHETASRITAFVIFAVAVITDRLDGAPGTTPAANATAALLIARGTLAHCHGGRAALPRSLRCADTPACWCQCHAAQHCVRRVLCTPVACACHRGWVGCVCGCVW